MIFLISQKKLLILISFFATLYILYQAIFVIPDILDAWELAQRYARNSEVMPVFFKTFGGMFIQLFFFGSVALWSFNEAFEKDFSTKPKTTHQVIEQHNIPEPKRENIKVPVMPINYGKIMKIVGITCLVSSMIVLGLLLFFMFYLMGEPDPMSLYMRLFLFAVLALVGVALWSKGKDATKDKMKPTKNFNREYEEQKKREMEDRT